MSKTKELIICIISIIVLALAITTTVFATDPQNLNDLLGNNTSTNNDFQQIEESNEIANNVANNVTNNVANNTTNNATNNANTSIPYTGVDYSVLIIIAICGVSIVYAYKKIKEYNV